MIISNRFPSAKLYYASLIVYDQSGIYKFHKFRYEELRGSIFDFLSKLFGSWLSFQSSEAQTSAMHLILQKILT